MSTLNLYGLTLAHSDPTSSSNPALRNVDWKRSIQGIQVENPKSEGPLMIPPGVEKVIFDGTIALGVDGTTAFSLILSTMAADVYRLTATAGTSPAFRTDRALDVSTISLTLAVQSNATLVVTAGTGTPFAALLAGDEVFIPGLLTGDVSGPFNALNQGRWKVLATGGSGANVTLVRDGDFQGIGEVVIPTLASQFIGFSSDGVQPGDSLELSLGFADSARKTYEIVAVTPKWVEIKSSTALANETGILPTAAGIQIFTSSKRFLQIEADQECVLRLNGDTSSLLRLSPWLAADPEQVATFQKVGPTWKLSILNKSSQTLRVTVLSAE